MSTKAEQETKPEPAFLSDLRRRAEKRLKPDGRREIEAMSGDEVARLLHELETHQIELELQNDELRRTQGELIEARDRYAKLYDYAPVGYLTLSAKGIILEANLTLAEMLAVPRASLIKRRLTSFIVDEDQDVFYRHRDYMKKHSGKNECELRFRDAEKESFWARLQCAPEEEKGAEERHGAGATTYRVIISDINRRKKAEIELARHRDHLEELVRQRMAEIARQSAELSVANREIAAFSYSVSHDLRGPLRRMDGFAQTLLNKTASKLEEQEKHYLQRICDNAEALGDLIDDLLGLSRITRDEMKHETVDLSAVVRKICDRFCRQEPQRDVAFEIENNLAVRGDPALLKTMLERLLENAWKFSQPKEKICIQFGRTTNGRCDLVNDLLDSEAEVFFIRDHGVGFDMSYADKLFGTFHRLHRQDEFEGRGIGLAGVQRIVHRHGGHVWGRGEPGVGATFYFNLPD